MVSKCANDVLQEVVEHKVLSRHLTTTPTALPQNKQQSRMVRKCANDVLQEVVEHKVLSRHLTPTPTALP